jgi:hypothetical protein
VAVPILIFVGCMAAGVFVAARWLPALEGGPVGGLAFFAVCGLVGAGLAVIGLHTYEIVEALDRPEVPGKGLLLSDGLRVMLYEAGLLFGVAIAVYLLAPAPLEPGEE